MRIPGSAYLRDRPRNGGRPDFQHLFWRNADRRRDDELSRPIHGSHSIPSASNHFDTNSQRALARIPPRVSSPLLAPSQKAPTSHGVTPSVQVAGLDAYISPSGRSWPDSAIASFRFAAQKRSFTRLPARICAPTYAVGIFSVEIFEKILRTYSLSTLPPVSPNDGCHFGFGFLPNRRASFPTR